MTIFKILEKKKFVSAKRLLSGQIVYKNQMIDPYHFTFVEKKALDNFYFIVRFNQKQRVIQLPFFNHLTIQAHQKKKIMTKFVDYEKKIRYISSDLLCFEADLVTKIVDEKVFMVRVLYQGGVLVKESPEKLSANTGTIKQDSMVLIESIELSFTECVEFVKLYRYDGYIYKNSVRLLGYANENLIQNYHAPVDAFPISFHNEKKCVICLDRECNSVFVHNDTGHTVCCYTCALKAGSLCPICRQKIEKVLLLF